MSFDPKKLTISLVGLFLTMAAAQANLPPLDGVWKSGCYVDKHQPFRDMLQIKGYDVEAQVASFKDTNCSTPTFTATAHETFQVGPQSLTMSGATEVDSVLSSIGLTFHDAGAIPMLNRMAFCGYTNWAVGAMKEVTGRECGGSPMMKAGDRIYDIAMVTGNSLMMGELTAQYTGLSPEARPRVLDQKRKMTKQ